MNRYHALVPALLLGIALPAAAQEAQFQTQAVQPLVEADWLREHVDDPDVVVLHIANRAEQYSEGHIPGAQALAISDVTWEGDEGWIVEFKEVDEIVQALRERGIRRDSKVVIYGSSMTSNARAWVTFDYLGLGERAFLLNGGLQGWEEAGGEIATGEPESVEKGDVSPDSPVDFRVSAEWILEHLEDESLALLDARPDDEYTGEDGGMGGRANPGHIPGAAQLYWEELMTDENNQKFRPASELEALLRSHGAAPEKTNVSYCMIGLRASVDYIAARMMGWNVLFYDGSWHDWGTREGVPIDLGPDIPR